MCVCTRQKMKDKAKKRKKKEMKVDRRRWEREGGGLSERECVYYAILYDERHWCVDVCLR